MAKLIFLPVADRIESGTYLLYDGACGTGGMLTVAEETLQALAKDHGKQVATHLYGQEINAETYAICKADLLLKGEGEAADNLVGGPEHSTLSNDAFPSREFDFMLSNPPYGKSWKSDLERMGSKDGMKDPRFIIEHAGDPEYSLVTRSSDGQMLFLANMLSKMKHDTPLGSRIAESTTARLSSPATRAKARATSGAGSSRRTGSTPSSRCLSTCSTTPALRRTSGC
jgi:type I restriction enzyme M protein